MSLWHYKFKSGFCRTGNMLNRHEHLPQIQHKCSSETTTGQSRGSYSMDTDRKGGPAKNKFYLNPSHKLNGTAVYSNNTRQQYFHFSFQKIVTNRMKNFIEGYWPQKLIQCQKEYLVRIGSKNPTSLLLPRTQ